MVAPLSNCTLVQRQTVICLFWSEGIKTSEPCREMTTQYGEHYMAQKMYKSGWTDLNE